MSIQDSNTNSIPIKLRIIDPTPKKNMYPPSDFIYMSYIFLRPHFECLLCKYCGHDIEGFLKKRHEVFMLGGAG